MTEEQLKLELDKLRQENAALMGRSIGTSDAQICKVSAKIPPFWPHRPAYWFATVEAQFELGGIVADNTKFNYLIGHLDEKYAEIIEDVVINPPPIGQRYEKIKEILIKRVSVSEESRVRQLLNNEELGDQKPSHFLRRLRSLAGSGKSDDSILRQLWLSRLPQQVQAILASQPDLTLDKMADLADNITEVFTPQVMVCAATPRPSTSFLDMVERRFDELAKEIASLKISQADSRRHEHSNFRGRSNSRPRSSSRGRSQNENSNICWYHKKFKTKATKCTKPCSWQAPENQSDNQ